MRNVEQLTQLANDIVDQKVFGSWLLMREGHEHDLSMVFMPLLFTDDAASEMKDVAHVYEFWDRAEPRGFNGLPIFFSLHEISTTEWDQLCPIVLRKFAERHKESLWAKSRDMKWGWARLSLTMRLLFNRLPTKEPVT